MSFAATLIENTGTVPSPAPLAPTSSGDEYYQPSFDDPRENQAVKPGSSDIPVDSKAPEATPEESPKEQTNNGQVPAQEPGAAPPAEKPAEKPPEPRHSADMIEQAARLQIPASEIEEMTPAELQRTVAHMHRFGQHVYDTVTSEKKAEPKETPKPKQYASYDVDKNEAGYSPEILDLLRDAQEARSAPASVEIKALKDEIKELKEAQQHVTAQTVQQRVNSILTEIVPDAAKEFDPRTSKGRDRYQELLGVMNLSYAHEKQTGKFLDETERAKRALGVMGVSLKTQEEVVKAKEETAKKEAMGEAREKWDQGALGKDTSRKTGMTPQEFVKETLARAKAREAAERASRGAPVPQEEDNGFLP